MGGKLKVWARTIKRDVHAIYLAARDPRTPWYAKALALCVAGYALSPIDLIPDFVPVLGYLDDLILLPLGILAVVKMIPPEVMAEHRAAAALAGERPVSRTAAVVIFCLWAVAITLTAWLSYRYVFQGGAPH
ncbi:YkvA family protein [Mesorhizobium sp. M0833]|uniref:YkvA family protein n=1 Tax=Mesorhizobium sp. M0833 TaxID=2957009 RepID=UPI00333DC7D0